MQSSDYFCKRSIWKANTLQAKFAISHIYHVIYSATEIQAACAVVVTGVSKGSVLAMILSIKSA